MGKIRCKEIYKDGSLTIEEYHKIVVHRFKLSDVEDPDLYAAEPIYNWQQTDAGKFVMENATEQPIFHRHVDYASYGYEYAITAILEKKKLSEYLLRWGPIK